MSDKIQEGSRYENVTTLPENDGEVIFVAYRPPIKKTDYADNIIHTVRNSDRIDLLSSRYYGTPQYGWVIADFNDLLFPDGEGENSLQSKEFIVLPSYQTLVTEILV